MIILSIVVGYSTRIKAKTTKKAKVESERKVWLISQVTDI